MKSNCVIYALLAWWRSWRLGEETYVLIRRSRARWGLIHVLHGKLDPATGQVAVTHFKPVNEAQVNFELTFRGQVVDGDAR